MTAHDVPCASVPADDRDRGSTLILVLVLMVVGSLLVLPMMTFAMSVGRANTVLSEKTKRIEAVKGGLRTSLADPVELYKTCGAGGPSTAVTLAPTTVGGLTVSSVCYYVDHAAAQSAEELRFGLTATQVGKVPPAELRGESYVAADPLSASEWLTATTSTSTTDKVWLPNLPVHGLNQRSPDGYEMPAGFPTCTVYFPGTYENPVTLDGPTYFASGIYYFEDEVRVEGGASVVVGLGASAGCSSDQESAFYAVDAPGTHNVNGLGGTWVFGDEGRLVVSNDNGAELSLRFNTRYVPPGDAGSAPSEDVSIISVNGELDVGGVTGIALVAPGVIEVPLSQVGAESPVAATQQEYLPSVLTPKPTPPESPTGVTATRFNGGVGLTWTAPFDGGSPITGYTVTASPGGATCTTSGATTCAIAGLSNGTPYTFTAVATNALGSSQVSDPSAPVTPSGTQPVMSPPNVPAAPTVVPYEGVARVSWTATGGGNAPVTGYTVTASPDGQSCTVDVATAVEPDLTCDVVGLNPALDPMVDPGYTFTVVATNAIGTSVASPASAPPVFPSTGLGAPPPPADPPAAPEYLPTPIIDVDLPGASAVTVDIPGYISIPQGRIRVSNPNALSVRMAGGVLAAQYDVADARATGPQTVDIGFLETVIQRRFRIVSTTSAGNERSTAIVQVNQNGAYAINAWEVQ